MVCATVIVENLKFNLVTVYRKPDNHNDFERSQEANLILPLKIACKIDFTNLVIGDFNLQHVDWTNLQAADDGIH
jgi:Endonuclease-reverse transcriptase